MAQYIQAFFLLSASTILLAANTPPLRRTLISYGPRAATPSKPPSKPSSAPSSAPSALSTLLTTLSTYRVPHSYFSHFYALSTASSLFWAHQYLTNGALLHKTCLLNTPSSTPHPASDPTSSRSSNNSMSIEQITLAWLLFLIHSLRRQLESTLLTPPSAAKMWVGHYLVGLAFYLFMGVAIWIEGSETLLLRPSITLSAPSLLTCILLPLLILASGAQHDAHAYLASLPKYTLPTHPLFQRMLCPHYTAEVVIYVCLTLLTAPRGKWVNWTVGAGAVFVGVNLGVTANGVRGWYGERFGREKVGGRWSLVPGMW